MTGPKEAQHELAARKSWRMTSLVLVVAGLLAIALATRKEPEFEGKTARQWARELPPIDTAREASPPFKALLKLGPAGFADAAKLLRPEASLLERFSEWAHPKSPGWLRRFLPPRPVSPEISCVRQVQQIGLGHGVGGEISLVIRWGSWLGHRSKQREPSEVGVGF